MTIPGRGVNGLAQYNDQQPCTTDDKMPKVQSTRQNYRNACVHNKKTQKCLSAPPQVRRQVPAHPDARGAGLLLQGVPGGPQAEAPAQQAHLRQAAGQECGLHRGGKELLRSNNYFGEITQLHVQDSTENRTRTCYQTSPGLHGWCRVEHKDEARLFYFANTDLN